MQLNQLFADRKANTQTPLRTIQCALILHKQIEQAPIVCELIAHLWRERSSTNNARDRSIFLSAVRPRSGLG